MLIDDVCESVGDKLVCLSPGSASAGGVFTMPPLRVFDPGLVVDMSLCSQVKGRALAAKAP